MRVLGARILVERLAEEPIKGSLIEVVQFTAQPSQFAKVIAVGPGPRLADGTRRPPEVEVGQMVVTVQYCGTPLTVDDQELFLVDENDILAVISS